MSENALPPDADLPAQPPANGIPPSPGRSRRQIAGMLIVIAIGAVGWYALESRRDAAEREAREAVSKLGGLPVMDSNQRHVATLNLQLVKDPAALREIMRQVPKFRHLKVLDLSTTPVEDSDLAAASALTNLVSLHLNETDISDAGLPHLRRLAKLEGLHLSNTRVTAASLDSIANLQTLRQLDLSGTDVASGLQSLDPLDQLVWILLEDVPLEEKDLDLLMQMDSLRQITIGADRAGSELGKKLRARRTGLTVN